MGVGRSVARLRAPGAIRGRSLAHSPVLLHLAEADVLGLEGAIESDGGGHGDCRDWTLDCGEAERGALVQKWLCLERVSGRSMTGGH
jgi:hypothetical protein